MNKREFVGTMSLNKVLIKNAMYMERFRNFFHYFNFSFELIDVVYMNKKVNNIIHIIG